MYGHSPSDVRRWPDDPAAHRALKEYLQRISVDPDAERTAELLLVGRGLDFTGADLSGLDLLAAEFSESTLTGVRLASADLYMAWLRSAQLSGADLSSADLRKAQGQHCAARNVKMCNADLQKADFSDSDFRGADLSGARLQRVTFSGSDLRGASLRDCTFRTTRFSDARLADCDVHGAAGLVMGPVDVGVESPHSIGGQELRSWFVANGAPDVEVYQQTQ